MKPSARLQNENKLFSGSRKTWNLPIQYSSSAEYVKIREAKKVNRN